MADAIDEPDELLNLVNEHDEPIGAMRRKKILSLETDGSGFARAVGVFVVNDAGKLWVPRRSMEKRVARGGLDFSAGEHVARNETYEAAALRGLREELNLLPNPNHLSLVGTVPPFPAMPYFHHVFIYHHNEAPEYNRSDFSGFEWLAPQELDSRLSRGEPAKEILQPSVQLLLQQRQAKGGHI